tara:strand:- start:86 stop:661 length:576 start_codon:yes stop_codon:yes gene_type:complete
MSTVLRLFPSLFGAIFGVCLALWQPSELCIFLLLAMLVSVLALWAARKSFKQAPVWSTGLLNLWHLFLPAISALAVWGMLWLEIVADAEALLPGANLSADQKAKILDYLIGVISGAVAVISARDPGKNFLWPEYHFRKMAVSLSPADALGDRGKCYDAANSETADENKIKGWGLHARYARARILANCSKAQ